GGRRRVGIGHLRGCHLSPGGEDGGLRVGRSRGRGGTRERRLLTGQARGRRRGGRRGRSASRGRGRSRRLDRIRDPLAQLRQQGGETLLGVRRLFQVEESPLGHLLLERLIEPLVRRVDDQVDLVDLLLLELLDR